MTATLPPAPDLRDCRLYRFWVRHPVTGQRVLGYIGETVRLPFERLLEHVYAQPWADTILAWEVDEVAYPGKQAVLDAEKAAILAELPLYNVEHNRSNRRRVIPPEAIRQRRARDLERRKPRWVHPDDRESVNPGVRSAPAVSVRRLSGARSWPTRRINLSLWSLVWAVIAVVLWGELTWIGLFATWTPRALSASLASLILCGWGLAGAPMPRRWERRWKRWRRRWMPWTR